jgi:hypothetical protein
MDLLERFMASTVREISLKSGMPTVAEGRERLNAELARAKSSGAVALKLIHGYGSGGVGGSLREGIRSSLRRRRKEGKIRSFVIGERWGVFDETARQILEECPELGKDSDLNNYNEGITIVLL